MKKNYSGAIGYILLGLFLYLAIFKGTQNPKLFFNIHGIAIVFVGVLVAAISSFPFSVLKESIRTLIRSINPTSGVSSEIAEQVVEAGSAYQKSLSDLEVVSAKVTNLFLSQSLSLILEGINPATVLDILDKRIDEKRQGIAMQMNVMLTLSKYSPALGLAATVLGLVDLLGQLQNTDMAALGYGMAIALSATFYGIVLSNLVFAPLSELIATAGEFETKQMEMIRFGLQNAMERKHALVVGEVVNSFLEEHSRIDFVAKVQSGNAA